MIDEKNLIKQITNEMNSVEGSTAYADGYEDGLLMALKFVESQPQVVPEQTAAVSQLREWLPSMLNCQSHLTAIVSAMMEAENMEEGE